MDDARQNETLRAFVARRERELLRQLAALRERIAPMEAELKEIEKTKGLLGGAWEEEPVAFVELDPRVAREALRLAITLPPAKMTQKQLILRAYLEHLAGGATPSQLVDCIRDNYRVSIEPGSLRPQLSRLRDDGLVINDERANWVLHPVAVIEAAKILGTADQVKVREMTQVRASGSTDLDADLTAELYEAPEPELPDDEVDLPGPELSEDDARLLEWAERNKWTEADDEKAKAPTPSRQEGARASTPLPMRSLPTRKAG